jgi:hypothetical protein
MRMKVQEVDSQGSHLFPNKEKGAVSRALSIQPEVCRNARLHQAADM